MLVFLFMRIATICLTALLVTECHRKHDDNGLPNRGAIKVRPPAELLAVASTGKERNLALDRVRISQVRIPLGVGGYQWESMDQSP